MTDSDSRLQELGPRGWTLLASTTYGLVALVVGVTHTTWLFDLSLAKLPTEDGGLSPLALVVGATLGAAVLGGLTWHRLVERSEGNRRLRGAASGLLTGVLGHVVMWSFHGLWTARPGDVFSVYSSLLFYLPFSVLLFGWVTGISGLLVGVGLAQARISVETASSPSAVPRTRFARGSTRRWVLAATAGFGLVGIVASSLHTLVSFARPFEPSTILPSTVLAAAIGGLLWWRYVERPREASAGRGSAVGLAVAVLTPVAVTAAWLLWLWLSPIVAPGRDPLVAVTPAEVPGFVAFAVVFSVGRIGLIAVPFGALAGYALAKRRGLELAEPATE